MYHAYFHIKENPFALTPDPRYLFMSRQHQEALAHLLYGMTDGGGFVQITGEVGTGKTTLCRALVDQAPKDVDIALILNPKQSAVELVASVCDELGVDYPPGTESIKVLVDRLNRFLLENHAKGRRTALVIDEAQNLSPETLEQIRLLTNLETTTQKLMQVILIGQPELQTILAHPAMRQLAQRITARYHLVPLSRDKTIAYVGHRLEVAGLKREVFTPAALRTVYKLSGGVPRRINILCDRALLGAYARQQERISGSLLRKAYSEVSGQVKRPRSRKIVVLAMAGLLLLFLAMGWRHIPWRFPFPPLVPASPDYETQSLSVIPRSATPKDPPHQPEKGGFEVTETRQDISIPKGIGGTLREVVDRPEKGVILSRPKVFTDLIREGELRTDKDNAFMALFRCWNLEYGARGVTKACEEAAAHGLSCIFGRGTWMMLKQYNRPAILELIIDESGQFRHVTVTGMGDNEVTLDFFDRTMIFPRTDIDPYWRGGFILLWKPPKLGLRYLKEETSGPDVIWLRKHLALAEGESAESDLKPAGPVFDKELKRRVMAFQRAHGLKADGIVGENTFIQLNTALKDRGIPLLAPPNPSLLR